MANEQEKQEVIKQDPIVDSAVEQNVSFQEEAVEEGVEASEEVNWETEAKKFQSMYDKKTAEHENLRSESNDLIQLRDTLNSRPDLVEVLEEKHETVDNELAKLQSQMAMNNLQTELVNKHKLGQDDAQEFLQFATTPKANLPIETLIKVWKEGKGSTAKPNENKKAVQAAKSVPKPAGVLQGGEQPTKSEGDQVWDRIMSSTRGGRLAK